MYYALGNVQKHSLAQSVPQLLQTHKIYIYKEYTDQCQSPKVIFDLPKFNETIHKQKRLKIIEISDKLFGFNINNDDIPTMNNNNINTNIYDIDDIIHTSNDNNKEDGIEYESLNENMINDDNIDYQLLDNFENNQLTRQNIIDENNNNNDDLNFEILYDTLNQSMNRD